MWGFKMSVTSVIAILVGVVGVIIAKVLSGNKVNPKIAELGVKAEATKEELAANDAKRDTLKAEVTADQANVTEEQKTQFWSREIDHKKD